MVEARLISVSAPLSGSMREGDDLAALDLGDRIERARVRGDGKVRRRVVHGRGADLGEHPGREIEREVRDVGAVAADIDVRRAGRGGRTAGAGSARAAGATGGHASRAARARAARTARVPAPSARVRSGSGACRRRACRPPPGAAGGGASRAARSGGTCAGERRRTAAGAARRGRVRGRRSTAAYRERERGPEGKGSRGKHSPHARARPIRPGKLRHRRTVSRGYRRRRTDAYLMAMRSSRPTA